MPNLPLTAGMAGDGRVNRGTSENPTTLLSSVERLALRAGRRLLQQQQQQQPQDDDDRTSVRSTSTQGTMGTTTSLASRLAGLDWAEKDLQGERERVYEPSIQEEEGSESSSDEGTLVDTSGAPGVEGESPMHRVPAFQVCARIFNYKANQPVLLKRLTIQQCEELKVNGYTIVDGLITRDLASHVKATGLNLYRKGRLEEGARAALVAGVQPDTTHPERVVRGDRSTWLTVGRAPADSWPLSTLLVALQEVYEDLAQFVKLRRCCGEYQISVQPAGAVGMSRHRDTNPESGSLQPQVSAAANACTGTQTSVQRGHASHSIGPSVTATNGAGTSPPRTRLAPHGSTGSASTGAASTGAANTGASTVGGSESVGRLRGGSVGRVHFNGLQGSGHQGSFDASVQAASTSAASSDCSIATDDAVLHRVSAPHSNGSAVQPAQPAGQVAAVDNQVQPVPAVQPAQPAVQQGQQNGSVTATVPLQGQHSSSGQLGSAQGPRRITCMVCCNPDWERDQGGVVRVWPPRRNQGPGGGRPRRSLTGSEAGLSQMSEDRSDTFSLRSHYLANYGPASVTSSMWAELGVLEQETASVDGSLVDAQDKEDRPGMEWQEVDGEVVVDVAPLPGRMLLFLSGALEHAIAPAAADLVSVTAWY